MVNRQSALLGSDSRGQKCSGQERHLQPRAIQPTSKPHNLHNLNAHQHPCQLCKPPHNLITIQPLTTLITTQPTPQAQCHSTQHKTSQPSQSINPPHNPRNYSTHPTSSQPFDPPQNLTTLNPDIESTLLVPTTPPTPSLTTLPTHLS